jgi:hypothetical protein
MSTIALHRSTLLADTRATRSVSARASAMACDAATLAHVRVGLDNAAAMTRARPLAPSTARLNAPNAITMAGYGATLVWLAAGPAFWPLAVAGLAADEVDGYVARATDETSEYGSLLDWAVDISLTGLVLAKLGMPWLLLAVTPLQVYLRERGWAPRFGSWRAVFTLVAIGKGV